MKIIGAGLSKTGTKSLNAALVKLGYTVYDYFEHTELLRDGWEKIAYDKVGQEALKEMYEGVDAVVAWPASSFWEEFLEVFPDPKVILTVRDKDEDFVESLLNQLVKNENVIGGMMSDLFSPTIRAWNRYRDALAIHTYAMDSKKAGHYLDKLFLNQAYRRHNAYVKQRCPTDRLLVFNCKEGWEPLCKFLAVPVPDEPFPHKNIKGEFASHLKESDTLRRGRREIKISLCAILLAGSAASFFCLKSLLQR